MKIQKRLKELGYKISYIDGTKGRETVSAIKSFQKDYKLLVDGVVGPVTSEALFKGVKSKLDRKPIEEELPWIEVALSKKGWHEVRNKKELYRWLKSDGTTLGDPSKLPWCGDFVETAIKLSLPKEPFSKNLKENPYWARNWVEFGDKTVPRYGAILVFVRKGGGHVGFYVGEDKTHYHVLGGNQSNSVTVSRILKKRCIGVRWPKTNKKLTGSKFKTGKGIGVTTNEE